MAAMRLTQDETGQKSTLGVDIAERRFLVRWS
jgi:hypothetical protein